MTDPISRNKMWQSRVWVGFNFCHSIRIHSLIRWHFSTWRLLSSQHQWQMATVQHFTSSSRWLSCSSSSPSASSPLAKFVLLPRPSTTKRWTRVSSWNCSCPSSTVGWTGCGLCLKRLRSLCWAASQTSSSSHTCWGRQGVHGSKWIGWSCCWRPLSLSSLLVFFHSRQY